jgi:hypothetical protein
MNLTDPIVWTNIVNGLLGVAAWYAGRWFERREQRNRVARLLYITTEKPPCSSQQEFIGASQDGAASPSAP